MAAIALGESTASGIARRTGVNRSTVSRVLAELRETGLVVETTISEDAPAIASRLALKLGGVERQERIKKTVEDSLQRRDEDRTKRHNEQTEKLDQLNRERQSHEEILRDQIM